MKDRSAVGEGNRAEMAFLSGVADCPRTRVV